MNNNEIIIYQTEDGQAQVDIRMEKDTVWLILAQMAELFQMDQSVIAHRAPQSHDITQTAVSVTYRPCL